MGTDGTEAARSARISQTERRAIHRHDDRLLADTSSRARFMAAARDRARRDGIILDQPKRTFPLRAAFERPGDGALGTPRRVPGNLNQPPYATRIAQLSAAKFFLGPP